LEDFFGLEGVFDRLAFDLGDILYNPLREPRIKAIGYGV
jgi:hypothetical protein